MRSKTKKSTSRLVGIWTFLLVLIFKVIFSTPAYAFLSSLDACAANPECVAVVGSELSPAVAAPTAEAAGTTILQGKPVDAALIRKLIEDCEGVIPDSDDFGSLSDMEAQEAAIAICNTLEACLDPTPQRIIKVSNCVADSIDAFLDESFNISESKVGLKKLEEAIASHPFAVREMAKQSEDLQRLKQAEKLDRDFVEWLRTSFDNDGKSLIDLA